MLYPETKIRNDSVSFEIAGLLRKKKKVKWASFPDKVELTIIVAAYRVDMLCASY